MDQFHRKKEAPLIRCTRDGFHNRAGGSEPRTCRKITITVFPLYCSTMHERPTSLPAPKGVTYYTINEDEGWTIVSFSSATGVSLARRLLLKFIMRRGQLEVGYGTASTASSIPFSVIILKLPKIHYLIISWIQSRFQLEKQPCACRCANPFAFEPRNLQILSKSDGGRRQFQDLI